MVAWTHRQIPASAGLSCHAGWEFPTPFYAALLRRRSGHQAREGAPKASCEGSNGLTP